MNALLNMFRRAFIHPRAKVRRAFIHPRTWGVFGVFCEWVYVVGCVFDLLGVCVWVACMFVWVEVVCWVRFDHISVCHPPKCGGYTGEVLGYGCVPIDYTYR